MQIASNSASPSAIASLKAFPVREPVSRRSYTVLKLTTQSGIGGYGECGAASPADIAKATSVVQGKPATATEVIRTQLASVANMQAAVNMALLDIVGKLTKAPVYRVLGGPTRNKARVLTPLTGNSDDALIQGLKTATAQGHRAFMIQIQDGQSAHPARLLKTFEKLRTAGGDNVDFALDGAAALSPGVAGTICDALERFHLLWFDEPCPSLNIAALQKLALERVTPLGFGRSIHSGVGFQNLLREGALDVLRPDIARNGITQIRRMAAMAETYYTAVAPYHDGGPIGTAAALQLAASLPNFFIQQIPAPQAEEDIRMRAAIAGTSIEAVKDGFAALPAGPGLGINVNEDALNQYAERAA
jgi:galactonate dehydratase